MIRVGILVLVMSLSFFTKAQFNDDFTDGDFTANPSWGGSTTNFVIDGANQLQSWGDSTTSDELSLTTSSQSILGAEWVFDTDLTFNPSTSNYSKTYLVSDQSDLTGSLNGYYLRIGETGTSDTFELYRQDGTANIKLFNGITPFTSSVNARIKITRDTTGLWEVFTDKAISGSYTSEGTIIDSTYKTTSFFGVYCKYSTASRFDMFNFDNFNVTGGFFVDITPPSISSFTLVSTNQIDVIFDENLDQTSAETNTNYSVDNGIGNPSAATLDANNKTVHLTFASSFTNGITYELIASNIDDLNSNTLITDNINFTYFIPSYRDVIITEIHPDPDVATSLPNTEFIELYNRSSSPIDLTGYEFTDASTTTSTFPTYTLASNEYVTICKTTDTSLFTPFGNVLGVSSFPSLNNAGDDLVLSNTLGTTIDEVSYLDNWYGENSADGISLEIINPNHPCSLSSNWAASTDTSGGTPSQQNSIFDNTIDTTAPYIQSFQVLGDTAVSVVFSEPLDEASVSLVDFSSQDITVSSFQISNGSTQILIVFGATIVTNVLYELNIDGIEDCIGNVSIDTIISFGLGVAPIEFSVMINEIYADESPSVGLPSDEFIELYNNTTDIISLDGCYFTDFSDTLYLSNINMLANSYLILSNNEEYLNYGAAHIASMPGINNTGEQIALFSKNNQVIHTVNFTDDWYKDGNKDGGGWTLEIVDPDNYCGEETNWAASVNPIGGTPGEINSIDAENPDLVAPELERAIAVNTTVIYVYFDEIMDESSLTVANFSINNQQEISNIYLQLDKKTVELQLSTTLVEKTVYTVTATGVLDCIGNSINASLNFAEFALPEKPEIGDIILNEILFNPQSGGDDFVELYNNSNKYIDLKGFFLLDYDEDSITGIDPIIIDYYVLQPYSYAWLTEKTTDVTDFYPKAIIDNVIETDLPTYSNSEGTVAIGFYDDTLVVADRFNYLDDYHHALLDEDRGVSLERVSFDGPTNEENSWHSASVAENYATPGYQNSQQLNIDGIEDQITIFPLVFTPDGDGNKDLTSISYSFDEIGYTLSITIFDSHGRLITNLVRNDLVGREGFYQWDGIDNQGQKANVGYHIVLVEVFDVDGNTQSFKKKLVVGAQF